METVDSGSTDDDSNPASPQRRHGNAWGYGKDLSETSAYVLLAQDGSSSPRLCSSMRKKQGEQTHNADKATSDGEGGTDRSTNSKDVRELPRKVSAASPRRYHVFYRVGSLNQVCVAKSDAKGLIDSCNPIPAKKEYSPNSEFRKQSTRTTEDTLAPRKPRMLQEYGITHMKTRRYAPQSNASERVNQSVLAAIRVNIQDDHTRWDEH